MTEAYLGFGSNLGCKVGYIRRAAHLLRQTPGIEELELSSFYRTAPVGKTDQDWFVNAAGRVRTTLSARALLERCLEVERRLHRTRGERWGPRTLDIDLLLFGEAAIREEGLEVPHPRLAERAFALAPLRELAPELEIGGVSAGEMLGRIEGQAIERLQPLVAVLGASEKEDRYAHKAQRLLMEKGYPVVPVSPTGKTVLEVSGIRDLRECEGNVDTVTIYIGSAKVEAVEGALTEVCPRRVIFNPGTENARLQERLRAAGMEVESACTLVLLRAGQFGSDPTLR